MQVRIMVTDQAVSRMAKMGCKGQDILDIVRHPHEVANLADGSQNLRGVDGRVVLTVKHDRTGKFVTVTRIRSGR